MKFLFSLIFLIWFGLEPSFSQENDPSWQEVKKSGKGSITVYWFQNDPYSFTNANGVIKGIEVEIMEGFQKYLQQRYKINISIQWQKAKRFVDVLERMKKSDTHVFGVAGFSFSEERKEFMKFSPSYMADIAVLVSTPDIPIVKSTDDLRKYLSGATALTAQGTVLEKELIQLRDENKMEFNIEYTGGSVELIKLLNIRKNSFGYLNLPVYLVNLDKGLTKLNRQNYLTKRYEGRGIGMPLNSDWDMPLNEYFTSPEFKQQIESIIANYINIDLYHFMETFTPENEVSLLNKEKDIQQMEIKVQKTEIEKKNQRQQFLIIIVVVGSALLLVIILLYRKQIKDHRQLKEQKTEIEAQADEIMSINNNLELIVKNRTKELEKKNKALEDYAFITAHKLRSPLSTILGLVYLLQNIKVNEEDKIIIKHLDESAKNLDTIIHEVMNAIEKKEPTADL